MSYVSLVVVALILHGAFALIKNEDLYPYGTEHGDKVLRKNDDLFTDPLVLKYPFPFFSGVYKSNYVSKLFICSMVWPLKPILTNTI